ncbi:MAG: GPW/gp25 family protein, partial [Gammaproteobacteria bacterium]
VVLLTALGERAMRPDLGCQAPDLVFAPGSLQHLKLLETSVRDAIRKWEPRVEIEFVTAQVNPREESRVTVNIGYKIRGTNSRNNLVFPFYLGTDFGNGVAANEATP